MPPLVLTGLPHDILLLICIKLDPQDLLSLVQTCRVLHAFAASDYVWHHINHYLPLDLSAAHNGSLMSLSGAEIKRRAVNALRLNENWQRKESKITRIRTINLRDTVIQMQPLGCNWLVTLSRSQNSSSICLSVWCIGDKINVTGATPSYCVAQFEPLHPFKFAASLQDSGDSALVAVLGACVAQKGRLLTVYQLDLKNRLEDLTQIDRPYLVNKWEIKNSGVFYYADISGPIIGAAVVHVAQAMHTHQIVLLNTLTNTTVLVDLPALLNRFDCAKLQFKMYLHYIVLVGVYNEQLKVHVRELPQRILSLPELPKDAGPTDDFQTAVVDYATRKVRNIEIFATSEPTCQTNLNSFSIMVAHSPFSTMEKGTLEVYQFPVETSKRDESFTEWPPAFTFITPPNVTLEPTCLGRTGRRAVWLEHQWNTDDYRLMKGSFPDMGKAEPYAVLLQPPEVALPFEFHNCQSLAFEESAGRLWLGFHTGEVYILEF